MHLSSLFPQPPEQNVIYDVSGTTVYVVVVILLVPAAGLVAWVVRYAIRKRDGSGLGGAGGESCSEAGLNCQVGPPPVDDDLLQVKGFCNNNNLHEVGKHNKKHSADWRRQSGRSQDGRPARDRPPTAAAAADTASSAAAAATAAPLRAGP